MRAYRAVVAPPARSAHAGTADVANSDRPDRARSDRRLLALLDVRSEPEMEVRQPLHVALLVATVELDPERLVWMQIPVCEPPLVEARRCVRLAARGNELLMERLVPDLGRGVDVIPGELIDDQQRRESRQLVECRTEGIDVVEDAAGDDRVERAGVGELLERDPPIGRTVGCPRVNRQDVVAARDKSGRHPAAVTAQPTSSTRAGGGCRWATTYSVKSMARGRSQIQVGWAALAYESGRMLRTLC